MRTSESAQELLEQLWIAAEEDKRPGVAVSDPIRPEAEELEREGLAEQSEGVLNVTTAGLPEAAGAIRRHRLAERLLADVLTTDQMVLDEQACRLEHALVEGLDESICTLLGHPRFCPHGKPIPQGKCCEQARDSVSRLIAPLSQLDGGAKGKIAYIQMSHPQRLQKMMAMGVMPGVPISVLRRSPSFVFEAGYSQFAVDQEIASDIFVRLERE